MENRVRKFAESGSSSQVIKNGPGSAGIWVGIDQNSKLVLKTNPDGQARTFDGTVRSAEITIAEAGAAGVYTGTVVIPAGAVLLDIVVNGVALWTAGTAATLIVGDGTDPDGYYTGVNLKATDLLAGESISFALAGGKAGAYIANSQVSPRYSATARNIIAEVTTTGTTATAGRTRVTVVYVQSVSNDAIAATYVAS
jgi:hypothetical protein